MKILLLSALLSALLIAATGCANLKDSAQLSVAADVTTTVAGVASGLTEVNPLITSPATLAATSIARVVAIHHVDKMPEPARTEALAAMSSVTWGIAASNAVIMASASNPAGLIVGLIVAAAAWNSTEMQRLHATICAARPGVEACKGGE